MENMHTDVRVWRVIGLRLDPNWSVPLWLVRLHARSQRKTNSFAFFLLWKSAIRITTRIDKDIPNCLTCTSFFIDQPFYWNYFRQRQWRRVQVFPCGWRLCSSNFASPGCRTEFSSCDQVACWKVPFTCLPRNRGSGWWKAIFTSWKSSDVTQGWNSGLSDITDETWLVSTGTLLTYSVLIWDKIIGKNGLIFVILFGIFSSIILIL